MRALFDRYVIKSNPFQSLRSKWIQTNPHRTTDAYMIGYPKSGNTWLQVMLGKYIQLLSGRDEKLPLPLFSSFDRWGRCTRWAPKIPRIQFTHDSLEWTRQTAADLTVETVVLPYRRKQVVLLVRSLPDVLVSLYWQEKTRSQPPYGGELADFIRDPLFGIEKATTFHRIWYEGRHLVPRLLVLRYEDLRSDAKTHFRRLLQFWRIPIDEQHLACAVAYSDFENMRKLEVDNIKKPTLVYPSSGLPIFATGDIAKTTEAFHVRKGQIGGYREYVSERDIEYLRGCMQAGLPAWFGYQDGFWEQEPENGAGA